MFKFLQRLCWLSLNCAAIVHMVFLFVGLKKIYLLYTNRKKCSALSVMLAVDNQKIKSICNQCTQHLERAERDSKRDVDKQICLSDSFYLHCFLPPMCSSGTYCPTGSAAPLPCLLGQYCDGYSLSTPTGDCSAGFFCNGSAEVPNPTPCAAGYYCVQGTAAQEPCVPGTFASARSSLLFSSL